MDQLFWRGNWEAIPEEEYVIQHEDILARENTWIIEGYVDEKMARRLTAADVILYLDYSGVRCFFRVLKRWLRHRYESRPELPNEALERFDRKFLWIVFNRLERPAIEKALARAGNPKAIRSSSPRELKSFLEGEIL
ncbi:MAG: hypothetical protein AAB916_02115 [Patescibacteria group bacterium]